MMNTLLTLAVANVSTNWNHLVVVFDNGNFMVYWDGALAGSTDRILGYTAATVATQLGSASPSAMSEGWVGMLDEVAFYADALTPEAIQAHYQSFFAGTPPVIAAQPKGGTYLPGVPLTLSVKATGPSLAYQWYKGTTALAGKTETTLSFASLATGTAGWDQGIGGGAGQGFEGIDNLRPRNSGIVVFTDGHAEARKDAAINPPVDPGAGDPRGLINSRYWDPLKRAGDR